ncbi:MAG TPA: hypothetical protein VKM55_20195 [Candidatus Lokiarchaeia archaeon]|nr:hypothetical protein [Candidatus Lokiarchaeia archaeon]
MDTEKKILIGGLVIVVIFGALIFVLGILHWISAGFNPVNDAPFLGYDLLVCVAFGTSAHLWSRLPGLPEGKPIKTLFKMMGLSFFVIAFIFIYSIIDTLLIWAGMMGLSAMIDAVIPQVQFPLFNIFSVRMPLSSVVTFAFIMLGVAFFIFPLERYVKSRKPWFAISMLICMCIIPLFIAFRNNWIALSIATTGIVLFVFINFVFMFYLYISLARMSAGKMRIASILVAFGLFSMIFVWIVGVGMFSDKFIQAIVQFGIGIASLVMFNTGFRIMK